MVFNSLCFPWLRVYNAQNILPKYVPCTFVGYSPRQKGFKCLLSKGRLHISHDIFFDEHQFPYTKHPTISSHVSSTLPRRTIFPIIHTRILNNAISNHTPLSPSSSTPIFFSHTNFSYFHLFIAKKYLSLLTCSFLSFFNFVH